MVVANKRSVMTLYSDPSCPNSHAARIVLAEKGVSVDIINIDPQHLPQDLIDLNPYHTAPTLVDRDLVLYQHNIMMEYLDERFPHPPLLPVYPVSRAECRLLIYRIERDWLNHMRKLLMCPPDVPHESRKYLADSLMSALPVFQEKKYFMQDEFTLIDCCLAPMLWRLERLGITLPEKAKPLFKYMDRIFSRDSFQASLSDKERDMKVELAVL